MPLPTVEPFSTVQIITDAAQSVVPQTLGRRRKPFDEVGPGLGLHACASLTQLCNMFVSCLMSKNIKVSKDQYLLGQNTTCKFLGSAPLSSYKVTLLKRQLKGEK